MLRIIVSLIMIIFGMTVVLLEIRDTFKKSVKVDIQDKIGSEEYLKFQRLLDITTGVCFITLGMCSLMNLLTGVNVGILTGLITLLNKISEFVINKKCRMVN